MNTKLTLSLNKSIIDQAKQYARKKNKSISKLVENYLKNIISAEKNEVDFKSIDSPLTDSICGIVHDNEMDYKILIEKARTERHI
jgi:hypothetical protein